MSPTRKPETRTDRVDSTTRVGLLMPTAVCSLLSGAAVLALVLTAGNSLEVSPRRSPSFDAAVPPPPGSAPLSVFGTPAPRPSGPRSGSGGDGLGGTNSRPLQVRGDGQGPTVVPAVAVESDRSRRTTTAVRTSRPAGQHRTPTATSTRPPVGAGSEDPTPTTEPPTTRPPVGAGSTEGDGGGMETPPSTPSTPTTPTTPPTTDPRPTGSHPCPRPTGTDPVDPSAEPSHHGRHHRGKHRKHRDRDPRHGGPQSPRQGAERGGRVGAQGPEQGRGPRAGRPGTKGPSSADHAPATHRPGAPA